MGKKEKSVRLICYASTFTNMYTHNAHIKKTFKVKQFNGYGYIYVWIWSKCMSNANSSSSSSSFKKRGKEWKKAYKKCELIR